MQGIGGKIFLAGVSALELAQICLYVQIMQRFTEEGGTTHMTANDDGSNPELRRTMHYWLGRTLRECREAAGQKPIDVARLAGYADISALNRFENAVTWPQKLDRVVAAYALLCGVEDGRELWARALRSWQQAGGVPQLGDLSSAQRAVLLALEAAQRQSPYDAESPSEPSANPNEEQAQ